MADKSKSRKSWREKLEKEQEPQIVDMPPAWVGRYGEGKMVIATPLLVDGLMRVVPSGKLVTIEQIRARLARDFGVGSTCPLTTGIFIRIAAEAAEEDRQLGEMEITPYWRVIRGDGSLIDRLPGGVEALAALLREEGHVLEPGRGKKPPKVREFESKLVEL